MRFGSPGFGIQGFGVWGFVFLGSVNPKPQTSRAKEFRVLGSGLKSDLLGFAMTEMMELVWFRVRGCIMYCVGPIQ